MQKYLENKNKVTNFVAYKEIRCPYCSKLIVKVSEDTTGKIEVVCRGCKKNFTISL